MADQNPDARSETKRIESSLAIDIRYVKSIFSLVSPEVGLRNRGIPDLQINIC